MTDNENTTLKQALKDTGMEEEMILTFMNFHSTGKKSAARKILTDYRQAVLNDIHTGRDRLYLIDFISRKWEV